MKLDEVLEYFGTSHRMEKTTGLSHQNMANWKRLGYVPITTQIKIERLTKGSLKADLNHCPRS